MITIWVWVIVVAGGAKLLANCVAEGLGRRDLIVFGVKNGTGAVFAGRCCANKRIGPLQLTFASKRGTPDGIHRMCKTTSTLLYLHTNR